MMLFMVSVPMSLMTTEVAMFLLMMVYSATAGTGVYLLSSSLMLMLVVAPLNVVIILITTQITKLILVVLTEILRIQIAWIIETTTNHPNRGN